MISRRAWMAGLGSLVAAPKRPNVLFIAVDDLRPELGIYGASHVHSPRMDELGRSGMVFTRAYCQMAVCNPSRASLLTGLRPDSLRVWDLKTPFRQTRPDAITLPQRFRENGYHTAEIGKIFHNIFPDPPSWSEPDLHIKGFPFDPDAVYRSTTETARIEQRKKALIAEGKQQRHIDQYGEWYLKNSATEAPDVPDNAYYDGAQTDVAVSKLQEFSKVKQPFFFGIGYYRPHLPFNAPKKYWDLYDRAKIPLARNPFEPKSAPLMANNMNRELRGYQDFLNAPKPHEGSLTEAQSRLLRHGYLASVSYVDAQVGRLLDALDQNGLRDNTIVVLWGDHGWKLGEHNGWGKMTNYEIDARVPLLLRAPGKAPGSCSGMVEFVDIYPTLCQLSDITPPSNLEGTSFLPLLSRPQKRWKDAVFHQFLREGIWVAPDGVEYMGNAIRTDRYRYIEWLRWSDKTLAARELYDLKRDPEENNNLANTAGMETQIRHLSQALHNGWRKATIAGRPQL
jgi:iduronate 2-sulfatase